jgi:hypothetical protein
MDRLYTRADLQGLKKEYEDLEDKRNSEKLAAEIQRGILTVAQAGALRGLSCCIPRHS